ncbi:transposable element Tcb1 transposase [Trichonephila clavipes]|nr:transposable element Tcb1 transposase [Trichonephila clavipes]
MIETSVKVVDSLSIIADQFHPHLAFVIPNGNGIFQQDSVPCQKARFVLERLEEHEDEFQLISWRPNSVDLNLKWHIWVFL